MNQTDDLIILHARWIIPVEPAGQVLEGHALVIRGGRIEALLPSDQARAEYPTAAARELDRHALIPGLINAHTHAAMSLLRGYADDIPLMPWLEEHIWPAERRWVNEDFVRDGTRLAMAEMIRGGVTCFNDMYFFPDVTAREVIRAGMRCGMGLIVLDAPTAWAKDADEYIAKGLAVHDEFGGHPLIQSVFAPHAPYTVSDESLIRLRTLSEELDLSIHMHVQETRLEVRLATRENGERPLARLDRLGLLTPRLMAVHMAHINDLEVRRMGETGVNVVHCPESNMKLGGERCPADSLRRAGVNVALGTDGAASNNDLNLLGEMRSAALVAKSVVEDAEAMPAGAALRAATLGGAQALGLGGETGSLEPGKAADITAIDLDHIETQPVYDPVSMIVYAAGRHQISDVWVAGKSLLRDHKLVTLDSRAIRDTAKAWGERIGAERHATS